MFSYNDLKGFIQIFLLLQSVFDKISDFEKLFKNIGPYLKRNGIVHAELFFSPSNFIKNGITFDEIMDIFDEEVQRIKKEDNIEVKLIVDVSRTFGISNAQKNLELVLKRKSNSLIGIGLGGDERKGPAKNFTSVFKRAKDQNLHRVAHAGEDVGPESIWDAINLLYAERIGHGISAVHDEKLIKYLVENQIPLEICPTSNIFTKRYVKKIENHPIKSFFEKGLTVTLNTDDPAFFNVELLDEYWNLYSKLKFSLDDIKKVIINGFRSSFITESAKKNYINMVNNAWEKNFLS